MPPKKSDEEKLLAEAQDLELLNFVEENKDALLSKIRKDQQKTIYWIQIYEKCRTAGHKWTETQNVAYLQKTKFLNMIRYAKKHRDDKLALSGVTKQNVDQHLSDVDKKILRIVGGDDSPAIVGLDISESLDDENGQPASPIIQHPSSSRSTTSGSRATTPGSRSSGTKRKYVDDPEIQAARKDLLEAQAYYAQLNCVKMEQSLGIRPSRYPELVPNPSYAIRYMGPYQNPFSNTNNYGQIPGFSSGLPIGQTGQNMLQGPPSASQPSTSSQPSSSSQPSNLFGTAPSNSNAGYYYGPYGAHGNFYGKN